jgi:hypothetical protein
MTSILKNKRGSALVGFIVVVVVLAALVYGGVFFSGITNQQIDNESTNNDFAGNLIGTLNQAKSDIDDIQEGLDGQGGVVERRASSVERQDLVIELLDIQNGDLASSPLEVKGNISRAIPSVMVELRNTEHEALVSEEVAVKEGGPGGEFAVTLNFEFSSTKEGFVAVYGQGDINSIIEIPVKFSTEN